MFKQHVVTLTEFQFATIVCSECTTEITVDLKYERSSRQPNTVNSAAPPRCPICERYFDNGLVRALDSIRAAYMAIQEQNTASIEFRIRDTAEETE